MKTSIWDSKYFFWGGGGVLEIVNTLFLLQRLLNLVLPLSRDEYESLSLFIIARVLLWLKMGYFTYNFFLPCRLNSDGLWVYESL